MRRLVFTALLLLSAAGQASASDPLIEAKAALDEGRIDDALVILDSFLHEETTGPRAAEAYFIRGRALFSSGRDYEDAARSFLMVPSADPSSNLADDALYYAGFLHQFHLNNPERALEIYRFGYASYPEGDFRHSIADKILELTGSLPPPYPPSGAPSPLEPPGGVIISSAAVRGGDEIQDPETDSGETAPFRPSRFREVTIQFEDAPLLDFIRWVSEVTGRNFLVDDDVRSTGNITIYSGRPIPVDEVYRVFLSVLETKGLATVEAGAVTKIVLRANAVSSDMPIILGPGEFLPSDRIVTRIFRIDHLQAQAVQNNLNPLVSSSVQLIVNSQTNTLIAVGPAASLRRVEALVDILDAADRGAEVSMVHLENAGADQVLARLNEIIQGWNTVNPPPYPPRIAADPRTNSLILVADTAELSILLDVIDDLDADLSATRILRAYPLDNARAVDLVENLKSLLGLSTDGSGGSAPGLASSTRIAADERLNTLLVSASNEEILEEIEEFIGEADMPARPSSSRMHIYALQHADAENMAEVLQNAFGSGGTGEEGEVLVGHISVVADPSANSLLVTAGPEDWSRLSEVIDELDSPQPQILVDAVILEVTLSGIRDLGVELATADAPVNGSTRVLGGTNFGLRQLLLGGTAEGLVLGTFRGSVVGPVLQALMESGEVNVISMPQVIATNNTEAEISAGNLIPVVTSQTESVIDIGGTSGVFQNIDYKDVGVRLTMTPQLGESDLISMELDLEVEDIRDEPVPNSSLALPAFTSRTLTTTVQVTDGDYVVLGGLISNRSDETIQKVPILGDIPGLGLLFRRQEATETKTNLLIFIRPRVVTDAEVYEAVTEEERSRHEMETSEEEEDRDMNSLDTVLPPE